MEITRMIKVAIAEDIDVLRNGFSKIVEREKEFSLVGAFSSGREIADYATLNHVDVILMDIEMEDADAGINAAKLILSKKSNVKIIFLTVHIESSYITEAMSFGASDYVVKNEKKEIIVEKIRNAFFDKVVLEQIVQKALTCEYVKMKRLESLVMEKVKQLSLLTRSESEIVALILEGKTAREISKVRVVEMGTIKRQIGQILKKCSVRRCVELKQELKELNLTSFFAR